MLFQRECVTMSVLFSHRNPILKHRLMDLKYMLFVDSTIADHLMHKFPCDLVSFGKIRSKGYGFAFRCVSSLWQGR